MSLWSSYLMKIWLDANPESICLAILIYSMMPNWMIFYRLRLKICTAYSKYFSHEIFLCRNWFFLIINDLGVDSQGPFYKHGSTLIPAWISNHMLSILWDGIGYPFANFNGFTVEVWEWISNFISHYVMNVITYQLLIRAGINVNLC